MFNENCELCKLCKGEDRITRIYYEDSKLIIVDCKTCSRDGRPAPMLVWKDHTMVLSQEDLEYILKVLKEKFPKYKLRLLQRQIKEHFHFHLINL